MYTKEIGEHFGFYLFSLHASKRIKRMRMMKTQAHFFWFWTCSLICLFMKWWLLSVYDLNSNTKCAYLVRWVCVVSALPRIAHIPYSPFVYARSQKCVWSVRASVNIIAKLCARANTHSHSYFHYSCFVVAFGGYRAQWSCIRYVLEILSMDRLNENREKMHKRNE